MPDPDRPGRYLEDVGRHPIGPLVVGRAGTESESLQPLGV